MKKISKRKKTVVVPQSSSIVTSTNQDCCDKVFMAVILTIVILMLIIGAFFGYKNLTELKPYDCVTSKYTNLAGLHEHTYVIIDKIYYGGSVRAISPQGDSIHIENYEAKYLNKINCNIFYEKQFNHLGLLIKRYIREKQE